MLAKRGLIQFIGYMLLFCLVLSSCGSQSSELNWPKPGRYAVQFIGVITASTDELIPIELAFIDVGEPWRTSELHSQINNLTMLSDKGELTVRGITYRPQSPIPIDYRYSTISVLLNKLEAGVYHFSQIRYRDEQKQEHIITIGDWELIITDSKPAPLTTYYISSTARDGQDFFTIPLGNTSNQAIQLFDTPITSSKYPISSTLHLVQNRYDNGTVIPSVIKPSSPSVSTIDIQPQQIQTIAFQLHGIEQLPSKFLVIQPTIEYKQQGQATKQMFTLPLHMFLPRFENDLAIKQYLNALTPEASLR